MLKDIFEPGLATLKEEITGYIARYGSQQIDSLVCWTSKEYDPALFIYSTDKGQYANLLEAFMELWTMSMIDEEEWYGDRFQSNMEHAISIFENWFVKDYQGYNFVEISPAEAENYIYERVELLKSNMTYARRRYPLEVYDCKLPNIVPGIYVNGSMIIEEEFQFNIEKPVLWAEQLQYDVRYAGYRELFLETEDKYIYFLE